MSKPWLGLLFVAAVSTPTAAPLACPKTQPPGAKTAGVGWLALGSSVAHWAAELGDWAVVPENGGDCPSDMARVSGKYCTDVRHHCRVWLDEPTLPYARCGEYEQVAECVGTRRPMSFCIDRFEYTAPGDALPKNHMSFVTGSALCRSLGKRICTEAEWNFACEGEQMLPYPYGWRREPKCNQDRTDLYRMVVVDGHRQQVKKDDREPADARPDCVSPFGVYNLTGNLDESVLREEARLQQPFRNALKGGWWMAARNRCRPATTAHDDYYEDTQVGVRCCADLATPAATSREPPATDERSVAARSSVRHSS